MAVSVASSPGAIAGRFVVGSSDDIVGWLWRLVGLKFFVVWLGWLVGFGCRAVVSNRKLKQGIHCISRAPISNFKKLSKMAYPSLVFSHFIQFQESPHVS